MFTAVYHLANRKITSIFKAFMDIYKYYYIRGFKITTISADGEFAALNELVTGIPSAPTLNLTSATEHVPEIERRIWVIKEQTHVL